MKKNLSGLLFTAAIATVVTATSATLAQVSAEAATFNFGNIANTGNTNGDAIVGQFNFSVVDDANITDRTVWTFNNAGPATSYIGEIYFEGITSILSYTVGSSSVKRVDQAGSTSVFRKGANPADLPQGNNIGFTTDLGIDTVGGQGANGNGIDAGQSLVLFFSGLNASSVEAKINSGAIRVGMHVKGIASTGGGSDSFVNSIPSTPTKPVPVPGFVFGILAAGALGGKRLLSKKQAV